MTTFNRADLAIRGYDPKAHFPPRWRGTLIDICDNEACPVDTRLALVLALLPDKQRVTASLYLVRNTPLSDGSGRAVADLITDDRLIAAMNVYERYAAGEETFRNVYLTEKDAFQIAADLDQVAAPFNLYRAALAAARAGTAGFLAVKAAAEAAMDTTLGISKLPTAEYKTQLAMLRDLLTKELAIGRRS